MTQTPRLSSAKLLHCSDRHALFLRVLPRLSARWASAPARALSNQSGFSLMEMMVALSLIGLLLAIATPSWNGFLNARNLGSAQDEAFQLMRQAQAEAIRRRVIWQASFREVNGIPQGTIHAADSLPLEGSWRSLNAQVRIAADTTLDSDLGVYRVQFDHNGRVNGQLGKLTFVGTTNPTTKRCVIISTLLGVFRKDENRRCE
ncbi:MAG TPA: type II secretion system protein [Chroococcidiopsis sp.]